MKVKLSEVRQIIREELVHKLHEFVSNEMPNGTCWKAGKKGWAAKNMLGCTDYYYGDNEEQNKAKADKFRQDSTRRPVEHK